MRVQTSRQAAVAAFALLLAAGAVSRGLAQTTYGSIVGTARDASGAVVPQVTVTVTNQATSTNETAVTNELGAYAFTTLFPGKYRIHGELTGFRPLDITGIQLQVNQVARFDLIMQVGQVSEKVEVVATLATLATETSDVGQVVENRQIIDLPLNGRSYLQLATLTNGVVSTGGPDRSPGPSFVSEGNRYTGNSFLIGGIDTRTQREGGYGVSISVDAVGEFKILQNAFAAEYGRGTTIVNATIKSGSNEFHGAVFEFLRNEKLDARYSYNFTNTKSPLRQNQFGTSVGGPIIHNKTFFFLNYESERVRRGSIGYTNMPTQAQLGGDLSSMSQIAKDPDTGVPFTGNVVPASRITQFGKAGAKYFRIPGNSPLAGYNYTYTSGYSENDDQGTARIDHNFNNNIRLDGFVTFYNFQSLNPGANEYTGSLATAKSRPTFAVQYTHVLSPTILNVFRGYYRNVRYGGQDKIATSNVAATEFGIKNVNPEAFAYSPPEMCIQPNFACAGSPEWQPTGATDGNLQFNEQFLLTRRRHQFKFGTDLRWLEYDDLGWANQNGDYYFNGQYTGNNIADYLFGIPWWAQVALRGTGKYSYDTRQGEFSFFAQDDFKVNSQLTLNLGLRYELVQFPLEIHDAFANWNFSKHNMDFAGKDIPRRMLPTPKKNFGPRLGLAYNPTWSKKTVIRGGFGMMYGNYRQYESGLQHFHPPYVNENFIGNDVPKPSFTMQTLWWPAITDLSADLSGTTVNYLKDKSLPLVYQYNVNIQRELPRNILFQIGYVGNKGVNLPNRYDANQAVPFDPANPLTINQRRPHQRLGFVSANTSSTYSNYNALDVHVERRFSAGLAVIGNYTWMKQMGIRSYDNYTVMDINNIRHNYGPSGSPHRALISWVYELPFGPGKPLANTANPVLARIIGGWQFNGIATFSSGGWLGIGSSVSNGVGSRAANKADATGLPANLPTGQRTKAEWFNTAAFVDPQYTRYGNSGEGVVMGPGSSNFDLSFFKTTRILEGKSLQFRAEMFNGLNHVNLYNPNTNVSDKANFGRISSAAAARVVQLGMKFYF